MCAGGCMLKRLLFSIIVILSMAGYSSAQSATISNGVDWLIANQNADKSWGGATASVTLFNATAAAISALKICGNTGSSVVDGLSWLNGQTPDSVNFAADRLLTNAIVGHDTTSDLNQLITWKNSIDGAWGLDGEYSNDILEIAITLQALHAVNYADYTNIFQAVNFLTTTQNSDGGWGASTGDASNAFVTAHVFKALNVYSSVFINQNSINQASTYLLTKQNADGGFATSTGSGQGSSPSKVYETALSIRSLIESGQGRTQSIQSGINYLTSSQLADGSWNDDPYSTALAIQALAEARPNLTVASSGITFSNPMPQSGATTTISVAIRNTGYDNASNVIVRFYLGDPTVGGTQIGMDQIIPSLLVGSTAQASITASFAGTGGKTIFVVVDPDNLISETSKADNKASARIWVATAPDLAVFSEDLKPSTYVPTTGTPFTLNYTVRNLGESAAGPFVISLYDGDPSTGSGHLLSTANVSGLAGSEIRTGTFGVTLTSNGNHTLYLVADAGSLIPELSKTNNTGTVTVNVGGTQTGADLAIASGDIMLTPSRPHAGDTVTISANVHNIGADAANNFTVEIFDGAPEAGGLLIASQTISLVAGGSQVVSTNWPIPAGIHDIVVVLDRTNQIAEMNKSNNRASTRVMTDMVDISISATDLVFTPVHPVNGDSVVLSIAAHNTGIKDTGAFNLALYDGDPSSGGVLLQTFPISNIPGDGSTAVSYIFTAIPNTYRFYVVADSENAVTELYENNNTAIRSLKIKAPGEILGPDLVPTKIDVSTLTTDPQTLSLSGNAHVFFQNKGDDKITSSFDVIIFEDMDGDGKYTSGVDNLLGTSAFVTGPTASVPAIWPEGAGMVSVPLSGTVKFLHSPLNAFVDSGDAILEQDETNNLLVSCKDCEVRPMNPIQPVVKWRYNSSDVGGTSTPPTVANIVDTNGDGKIDEHDMPAVIFSAAGTTYPGFPKIVALRGDTGQKIFDIYGGNPNGGMCFDPFIATGDIDNDGYNEIVVMRQQNLNTSPGVGILAYDHSGNLKWDNKDKVVGYNLGLLSNTRVPVEIADIDNDGKPEIILGSAVFNGDGSVKWVQPMSYDGYAGTYGGLLQALSTVVDLDLDGKQEVLVGNRAYNSDGTIRWWNTALNDGISVIANFDDDPYPDIVYAISYPYVLNTSGTGAWIYLLDHTGKIKWGPVIMRSFEPSALRPTGSIPIIADVDGDGKPEIVIKTATKIVILDKNGTLKREISVPDNCYPWGEDRSTAPTVFDLNGDGRPEIIINSRGYFRIYDGKEGSLLFEDAESTYCFSDRYQRSIISDVDSDGHAEIVVSEDGPPGDLIRVYGSSNNDWVGSRKIWNQANYHVTNVNDNGSIPQYEAPSWLMNNTYNCQSAVAPTANPYLTPNLTASYMRAEQADAAMNLAVRVGNGGAIASGPTVTVTFYDSDPAGGGTIIGTAFTTRVLNPGDYQDVIYNWSNGSIGLHHIYAVVDAANAISECRKDDNQASVDVTIATGLPDLKVGAEDIIVPVTPITEGSIVPITAGIRNQGAVPAFNIPVKLYNGNPASGGTQIGTTQTISGIAAGGAAQVLFSYDTLGHPGTNILYVSVDPDNTIGESSKANNEASISINVQPPTIPDLVIIADSILISPVSPKEGDQDTVSATITNRGAAVGNIPIQISVGNQALGTKTIYPVLGLGQTATVTTTLDTTGLAGQQSVVVTIDPGNTIIESRKDNNSASLPFFVQSSGLNASITLDKTNYQSDEVVTATLAITDTSGRARALNLSLAVNDSAGNRIATISSADPLAIGPNGSTILTRTWNTGASLSGQYAIIAELSESGRVISRKSAGFAVLPDTRASARVTTDKMSYNPNETATLTAVATSLSRNTVFQDLKAKIIITGVGGQGSGDGSVYTQTKSITSLMPGAAFTFNGYWNASASPKGAYTATLTIMNGQTVLATSSAAFQLLGTAASGNGLLGTVSVSDNSVDQGTDEAIAYRITNKGNEDIANLAVNILIVNPDTGGVEQSFSAPTGIPIGQTITGNVSAPTLALTPRAYMAVLQAQSTGMAQPKTIANALFTVRSILPPTLTVSTLPNGSYTNNPVLNIAGTASDANGIRSVVVSGQTVTISTLDNINYTFNQAISLATGSNSITTVATDNTGKTATDTRTIILDRTAPVITIIHPSDNSVTNEIATVVTGTVDQTATVLIALGSGPTVTAATNARTFSLLVTLATNTNNTIFVYATDLAGNPITAKRSVTHDDTRPALAITVPNQDMGTNQAGVTISGTVSDLTNVTMLVTCPTASIGVVSRPTSTTWSADITNMRQGTNTITVQAVDQAGNSTSVIRNIISSTTPVTIDQVKSPTNNSQQQLTGTMELNSTVTINCPTATMGTSSYPTATTWQTIIAGMAEGANIISATATDLEGHTSNPVNATIVLDSHTPITTPNLAPGTYNSALSVSLITNEPATIYYTVDGTTPTTASHIYGSPIAITASTMIEFFAIDAAGNREAVKSAAYVINSGPPTYNFYGFFSPVDNSPILNTANSGQAIPVKWKITDANGTPVSNPARFISLTSYLVNCNGFTGDPADAIEEYAAGSSGLQYLGNGNWQYNWATSKTYAKQCRIMVLTLGDNSTHTAYFKFNK